MHEKKDFVAPPEFEPASKNPTAPQKHSGRRGLLADGRFDGERAVRCKSTPSQLGR